MTDAQLDAFRQFAAAIAEAPADWQWIGPYMSQRHFGITERQAREYAARHGGVASKMEVAA
jgi:hypothetical protein